MKQLIQQKFKFLQSEKKLRAYNTSTKRDIASFRLNKTNSVAIYFVFQSYSQVDEIIKIANSVFNTKKIIFLMFKPNLFKDEMFEIPVFDAKSCSVSLVPNAIEARYFMAQLFDLFISLVPTNTETYIDGYISSINNCCFRAGALSKYDFAFDFMFDTNETDSAKLLQKIVKNLEIINV